MPFSDASLPSRRQLWVGVAWIVLALLVHAYFVRINWTSSRLSGQEFRQTQTAISALFIQRDHNYGFAYPTPVLGPPWSVPMEFPLYQWTAVGLSNATGLSLPISGRIVSLACLYLTLPALYLLLGALGIPPPHRLLGLGLVLLCPTYILFARAFLIESMALMFSLWYLVAFVRAMTTRRVSWLVAVNLLGIAAATVKVTTFAIYLLAAAIWGCVLLWRERPRRGESWVRFRDTLLYGVIGCALAPLVAVVGWVKLSDQIKSLNPSAGFLVSGDANEFVFGTLAQRFSGDFWLGVLAHWDAALQPGWCTLATLLALLAIARRSRATAAGLFGLFLAAQLIFSNLYFLHQYYFFANGVLLVLTTGVALGGLLELRSRFRWMAWAPWLAAGALGIAQFRVYQRDFLPTQQLSEAGGEHTRMLQSLTDPDDVIVVVGDDWSSIIPYYTERRALMIRTPLEGDENYLAEAFAQLRDQRVGALVVSKNSLAHNAILTRAENSLGILRRAAVTYSDNLEFYFHEDHFERVEKFLRDNEKGSYHQLKLAAPDSFHTPVVETKEISIAALADRSPFSAMTPQPVISRNLWGNALASQVGGVLRFNAHAPSELLFKLPPGKHRLVAQYGMTEGAYLRSELPNSDGVTFSVLIRRHQRPDRRVWEMFLDPQNNPADRPLHQVRLNFTLPEGADLILRVGTGRQDNNAFDWAYWGSVKINDGTPAFVSPPFPRAAIFSLPALVGRL